MTPQKSEAGDTEALRRGLIAECGDMVRTDLRPGLKADKRSRHPMGICQGNLRSDEGLSPRRARRWRGCAPARPGIISSCPPATGKGGGVSKKCKTTIKLLRPEQVWQPKLGAPIGNRNAAKAILPLSALRGPNPRPETLGEGADGAGAIVTVTVKQRSANSAVSSASKGEVPCV
jgi:hypothetical protein